MLDVSKMIARLRMDMSMFNIAANLTDEQFAYFFIIGLERFYNATGQGYENVDALLTYDPLTEELISVDRDFSTIERSYVLVCAKIAIGKWAQANKAELVSYTTDALSVAHGDKPFKNITEMVGALEQERRELHYKLREAMASGISI